mmetsp:Transcript_95534/g.270241  ORF Transcript_95534/g.270241 Transcript_95534/m.270241 type:complete len:397 (-) Transcript_95534:164-1354(-)
MSFALVFGVLFATNSARAKANYRHGYVSSRPHLPREAVPGAVSAETLVSMESLPKSFDWRDVNGVNLVTADWNQHIPQYCGACWIHGTVSPLNDRIKIMRKGRFPDVMLGRQSIMNCVPASNGTGPPPGCNGGDAWMIHKYMSEHRVPDESCMPYQGKNMGCQADTICRNCVPGDHCFPVPNYIGYGVSSYGNISGEVAMMKEIYARGPIACSFATDGSFMFNYSQIAMQHEGVFVTDKVYTSDQIDHVMEVAGWGETPSGMKYWVIRNSWGTFWGNLGWLKLQRGVNMLLSESDCDWAVPTFDDLDSAMDGKVLGSYMTGVFAVNDKSLEHLLAALPEQNLAEQGPNPPSGDIFAFGSSLTLLGGVVFLSVVAALGVTHHLAKKEQAARQPLLLG